MSQRVSMPNQPKYLIKFVIYNLHQKLPGDITFRAYVQLLISEHQPLLYFSKTVHHTTKRACQQL